MKLSSLSISSMQEFAHDRPYQYFNFPKFIARMPLKILIILISPHPDRISLNDFWVLDISCGLASPPISWLEHI